MSFPLIPIKRNAGLGKTESASPALVFNLDRQIGVGGVEAIVGAGAIPQIRAKLARFVPSGGVT